jgi:hypothetical protein
LFASLAATGAELLLVRHTEDWLQWVPLVLVVLAMVTLGWHGASKRRRSVQALRVVMVLFMLSGIVGIVVNMQAKMEFRLESDPSLSGLALAREALKSQTPPALAPGMMMNPWSGRPVVIREAGKADPVPIRIDKSNGECLVFSTVAGRTYSIQAR